MVRAITAKVSLIMNIVWQTTKLYLFWAILHFVAVNLYQRYCAEWSMWGFIASSFNVQFPHCKSLMWIVSMSIRTLDYYWVIIIATIAARLTGMFGGRDLPETNEKKHSE